MAVQKANYIWRDFNTDGVAASGAAKPKKREIRERGTWVENLIQSALTGGTGVLFQSKELLDDNLNYPALTMIWVMNDPVSPNNNGIYQKQGATGAGSWFRVADLPYSFITASNAGAGTANAIVATSSIPIPVADGGALITVNVTADNTGPATVAFNGGPDLNIISSSGNAMQSGYLEEGMMITGLKIGSDFRLLTDAATAAMVALVEQAVLDAQAARDATLAAMSSVLPNTFATKASAEAYAPEFAPDFIQTVGETTAGDGRGALYVKNGTTTGALVITLDDGTTAVGFDVAPKEDGRYSAASLGLCDGTDAADRLVALVTSGIASIDVPSGQTMKITTPAIINTDEDVSLGGEGTIDCSTPEARIEINGSYTLLPALSVDVAAGATILTFASAHGLAYNDRVVLEDTRAYSAGLARHYYHNGCNVIVASVDSSTQITVFGRIPVALAKANTEVGKISGKSAIISGHLNIIPNTSDYAPIIIRRRRGVRIAAPKIPVGSGYTNMTVSQCYDVIVDDVHGNIDLGDGTSDAYPITFNSCHKGRVKNIIATFSPRHGFAIGGGGVMADNHGNVPTRNFIMSNCILESSGTVGAGDMHGAVFDSEYTDCIFNPTVGIAGGGNRLVNPIIYATDGRCVRMTELFGGTTEIINPKFIVFEANDTEGIVFLLTNMLSVDTDLIIHNATIENRGPSNVILRPVFVSVAAINWDASTGAYPAGLAEKNAYIVTVAGTVDGILRNVGEVWIYPGAAYMVPGTEGTLIKSTQPKVNVSVTGETHIINADQSYVVTLGGLRDMSTKFTLDIENVKGGSGRYFVTSLTGNATGCKVRLPRQTLRFSGTTPTASQDLIPTIQSFPWQYPKKPCAVASWWTDADTLMTSGLADVFCTVGRLTATQAQPYLRKSAAAWASATALGMAVEVWIDEL